MHKPWHSLVFGTFFFAVLGLGSYTFPESGVKLTGELQLNFPSLHTLFGTHTPKNNVAKIINSVDEIDTSFAIVEVPERTTSISLQKKDTGIIAHSEPEPNPEPESEPEPSVRRDTTELITGIQFRNRSALQTFFKSLTELKNNPKAIRVLHYGDSQIEGDRITDYLRLKLQGQFGGQGPGMTSLMPITSSVINRISTGPGWDRYNVFTMKDKRVTHSNYGVLAGFCRYIPYKKPSDTNSVISSSISITTTKLGGTNALGYKTVKLFYGGAQRKVWSEFYDGPALIAADSLEAGGNFRIKEYQVGRGSNTHTLKFRGKDSPDFYAMSLESENGIMVDNIALRGSSGTFFHQINNAQLKQFYEYLNVKLIILQFGGNSLPAIENSEMAVNFGNYVRYQISVLKKMAPGVSIIFIGPSDMSIKKGTEYITYPYLEEMRDAIKKAVLDADCAFFDMYAAMGGKNSMPVWVEQKLAATDYTHFSPQGARKIATLFYSELIKEYNNYLKSKN